MGIKNIWDLSGDAARTGKLRGKKSIIYIKGNGACCKKIATKLIK